MDEKFEFRKLRAEEIECRVGVIKDSGFQILLYKDARCDQNILDEIVGPYNWQRDHKELKGNIYCGVSIWNESRSQWVTKWDCGAESNTEKEKGEASDSFKRACFNWGIGRELYTAKFIWIQGNVKTGEKGKLEPTFKTMYVSKIDYIDNRISSLEIIGVDEKRKESMIYTMGTSAKTAAPPVDQNIPKGMILRNKELEKELDTARWSGGKHEGELISATDSGYLEWYIREGKNAHVVELCKYYRAYELEKIYDPDLQPFPEDGLPF